MAERNIAGGGGPKRMKEEGYEHYLQMVTPERAAEWLVLCTHNRPPSPRAIDRYARDMEAKVWEYTGDPIRFNGDGSLIDGRHRLMACVRSKVSFPALIIKGLPASTQEKLDQGTMRTAAHHLALRNYPNQIRLAATARFLFRIKHRGENRAWGKPTNAEVLALVDKHQRLPVSAEVLGNTVVGVHPSMIGAIHYIGARILRDVETADSFVSVFTTGVPHGSDDGTDPVHLWRERLIRQDRRHEKLRISRQLTGTIHAWNLHRAGERIANKRFQIPDDDIMINDLDPSRI